MYAHKNALAYAKELNIMANREIIEHRMYHVGTKREK
jgi:hypothetical protein